MIFKRGKIGLKYPLNNKYFSGIYFLIRKDVVVYIGQTTNFKNRMYAHKNGIPHDHIKYIHCHVKMLDYYEMRWISIFNPEYNFKPR